MITLCASRSELEPDAIINAPLEPSPPRLPALVQKAVAPERPTRPVLTHLIDIVTWRAPLRQPIFTPAPVFGLGNAPGIPAPRLPLEIQLHVLSFVTDEALVTFGTANRDLRILAAEESKRRYRALHAPHRAAYANQASDNLDFLRYFAETTQLARMFAAWPGGGTGHNPSSPLNDVWLVRQFPLRVKAMLNSTPTADCAPEWLCYLPQLSPMRLRQAAHVLRVTRDAGAVSAELLEQEAAVYAELGDTEASVAALKALRRLRPTIGLDAYAQALGGLLRGALHRDDVGMLAAYQRNFRTNHGHVLRLAVRHGSMNILRKLWFRGSRVGRAFLDDVHSELRGITWNVHSFGLLNPGNVPFHVGIDVLDSRRLAVKWCEEQLTAERPWQISAARHRRRLRYVH